MRILITGSNGQLGSEIRELAANYKKLDFIFKDLPELDICNFNLPIILLAKTYSPSVLLQKSCNCTKYRIDVKYENMYYYELCQFSGNISGRHLCKICPLYERPRKENERMAGWINRA